MLCRAPDCQPGAESWTSCFYIFLHTLAVIAVLSLPDSKPSTLAGLSSAVLEASNNEHGYHTCIMTNHVVVIMRCSLQLSIWTVVITKLYCLYHAHGICKPSEQGWDRILSMRENWDLRGNTVCSLTADWEPLVSASAVSLTPSVTTSTWTLKLPLPSFHPLLRGEWALPACLKHPWVFTTSKAVRPWAFTIGAKTLTIIFFHKANKSKLEGLKQRRCLQRWHVQSSRCELYFFQCMEF